MIKKHVNDNYKNIEKVLKNFKKARILVIGDVMIDDYLFGKCTRVSPEAPVPIVEVSRREYRLGGAANVAQNLVALGSRVSLCGVMGNDGMGRMLTDELEHAGIDHSCIFAVDSRPTTVKTRIMAHNQQIARTDIEHKSEIPDATKEKIYKFFRENIDKYDAVIISDYAKGVISKKLLDEILPFLQKKKKIVTVDPKIPNFYHYRTVTAIKPNKKELSDVLGAPIETEEQLFNGGRSILHDLSLKSLLVTLGEEGMCLFTDDGGTFKIPTVARAVYDVTGAGDTAISAFTLALVCGADFPTAAVIANFASSEVVGMLGTSVVNSEQVLEAIKKFKK